MASRSKSREIILIDALTVPPRQPLATRSVGIRLSFPAHFARAISSRASGFSTEAMSPISCLSHFFLMMPRSILAERVLGQKIHGTVLVTGRQNLIGGCLPHSKTDRGSRDCLTIEERVPVRTSLWSGTGTVTVPRSSFFCITIWLPLRRTSWKP